MPGQDHNPQSYLSQQWNVQEYSEHGRFVADLGAEILRWLAPSFSEEILDIGCGDGVLTRKIMDSGAQARGIDRSEDMVAAAQKLGVNAQVMDATCMSFHRQFDAVFSNAALHWIQDQPALLAAVAAALKHGGRFVAEMGGHGNIAAIQVALHAALASYGLENLDTDKNYFPTSTEYRRLLETHGFVVEVIELVPRPTPLHGGMRAWLKLFRQGLFQQIPEGLREPVLLKALAYLKPVLCDRDGNWTADYVRLRFRARLKAANTMDGRP